MTDNPWKGLSVPTSMDLLSARRIDANIAWNFFWARDVDRHCMLVLRHSSESMPRGRTPRLKGIDIAVSRSGNSSTLAFRLLDSEHQDIFYRLCRDIVETCADIPTEKEVVAAALARTWRWHHLLRGGGDGRLSEEEQKGLAGELLVLERFFLPCLTPIDAISTWCGPLGAPKDFEIGRICVEAKARRGTATPFVVINSEHQLDDSNVDALFLNVIDLHRTPSDSEKGFTVSDLAKRVREQILSVDEVAVEAYESLLLATGFGWEDDYSDYHWIEGQNRLYRVTQEFPRITPQQVLAGISNVKYYVSLIGCEPFLCSEDTLTKALTGKLYAD